LLASGTSVDGAGIGGLGAAKTETVVTIRAAARDRRAIGTDMKASIQ
jgi:hypothetical protein